MDLEQLFTVTDYQRTTIRIPCYQAEEGQTAKKSNDNDDDDEILTLDLLFSPAACTDYDLTGQILWPVSVLLSHYLASQGKLLQEIHGVVELGAGTGLPGLTAAHFCRQVALTDGNEIVLDLLRRNVSLFEETSNNENKCFVTASQLVWGNREHLQKLLQDMEFVDIVVAADVVQWPAVLEPLLHTVKALLYKSNGVFCLGIVNRARSTYNRCFELAQELGFSYQRVPPSDFLPNGVVPASCQEHGGRETEIFRLTLTDRSQSPVLLQPNAADRTVGTSYEQTAFLPC